VSTLPVAPLGHLPRPQDRWRGWAEVREDLPRAAVLLAGLAAAGVPTGLVWWALAPRARFRITEDGPAAIGSPSTEILFADDGVFVLVLAALGLLAGLAAWFMRRHRGVALLVALGVGTALTGAVAWGVGGLLGRGPTEAELSDVGAVVSSELGLGSMAALAVAPFVAVLVYVLGVIIDAEDGGGGTVRRPPTPPAVEDSSFS